MARVRGFPENGELVVCTVKSVKNFGAFVSLDEYDDKEGFVHVRDVATGWVKYIRDYVREGQKVVCKVLGVDSSKGHIDLSLKAVNDHQKREKIQQWKNEKKAEKLVEIVAERMKISVDKAYDLFGNELLEDYESLYDAFESAVADTEAFLEDYEGAWIDTFLEVARENVAPPSVQIDGILEMTSYAPNELRYAYSSAEGGRWSRRGDHLRRMPQVQGPGQGPRIQGGRGGPQGRLQRRHRRPDLQRRHRRP